MSWQFMWHLTSTWLPVESVEGMYRYLGSIPGNSNFGLFQGDLGNSWWEVLAKIFEINTVFFTTVDLFVVLMCVALTGKFSSSHHNLSIYRNLCTRMRPKRLFLQHLFHQHQIPSSISTCRATEETSKTSSWFACPPFWLESLLNPFSF